MNDLERLAHSECATNAMRLREAEARCKFQARLLKAAADRIDELLELLSQAQPKP